MQNIERNSLESLWELKFQSIRMCLELMSDGSSNIFFLFLLQKESYWYCGRI